VLVTSTRKVEERKGPHARFVVSALLISRSIRRDSVACLYLSDAECAIMFYGSKMRHLRADESSAFGIIRKALRKLNVKNPHPGVYIYKTDLTSLIRKVGLSVILLRDDRASEPIHEAIRKVSRSSSLVYITGFESQLSVSLDDFKVTRVKFPCRLNPEQEVTIVNILLDQFTL